MAQTRTILVGDAGGTNVRFAFARTQDGKVSLGPVWKRPGREFTTFDAALDTFMSEQGAVFDGASFGVAGAVTGDTVELMHAGWAINLAVLPKRLGVSRLVAVNDFVAMARAAPELTDTEEIASGQTDPLGSIAVGGPGTGFGIAIVRRLMGAPGWVIVGGEGGHQAFAPQTELEWLVLERLQARHGYVSNEMIASGSGFADTYGALAAVMQRELIHADEPSVLAAAEQGDPLSLAFCRLRARTVMTAMGNMALMSNATGGVYLAGGVSTRIASYLRERQSLERFYGRGARTDLLGRVPIRLITSQAAPLIGAAHLWLDEEARGWL